MSYDWTQVRFEQRIAFSVVSPLTVAAATRIADTFLGRRKPRVYDFRDRQSRDALRARI